MGKTTYIESPYETIGIVQKLLSVGCIKTGIPQTQEDQALSQIIADYIRFNVMTCEQCKDMEENKNCKDCSWGCFWGAYQTQFKPATKADEILINGLVEKYITMETYCDRSE